MQGQELVNEGGATLCSREAFAEADSDGGPTDLRPGPREVLGIQVGCPLLPTPAQVPADVAAEGAPGGRGAGAVLGIGPDHLIEDEHPPTGWAAGRKQIPDRHLEAGVAQRRGGQGPERGVEVAQVRRAEDDLGQEPSHG